MDKFIISGGGPLSGEINISGAKNSVLPLMIASILTDDKLTLSNIPYLTDVITLVELLEHLGVIITIDSKNYVEKIANVKDDSFTIILDSSKINNFLAPYSIVGRMRASFWVLGPLLAKYGQAKVSLPGGCTIGTRQLDMHFSVLEAMGAKINLEEGYVNATVNKRLKGINFTFPKVSVGATINAIMSSALADGESNFINCACEPEIADLCVLLTKMGAKIEGISTNKIRVIGRKSLNGACHSVIPDRIEAGTYICAVGITGGQLKLKGIYLDLINNMYQIFQSAGIELLPYQGGVIATKSNSYINPVNISTAPFPGFPTDMQAQFMALMCLADGMSIITENMYENRLMHVPELLRMGANITVKNNTAIVSGISSFKAAQVTATDLRASVCLILAGLVAKGKTTINNIYHIDRGYSRIEHKLNKCGSNIIRVNCTNNI